VTDELRAALYKRLKQEILDQAATWTETFDAGPGEVVSVSDAASVAARVLTPTDKKLRDELAAAIEARVKAGTFEPDPFGGTVGSFFGATCHDLADVALALLGARVEQAEREGRRAMLTLVKAAGGRVRIPERIPIETDYDVEVLTMQDDRVTGDVICEARGGQNEAGRG
jgi:hypothetical protein